jgi:hypothetical protein
MPYRITSLYHPALRLALPSPLTCHALGRTLHFRNVRTEPMSSNITRDGVDAASEWVASAASSVISRAVCMNVGRSRRILVARPDSSRFSGRPPHPRGWCDKVMAARRGVDFRRIRRRKSICALWSLQGWAFMHADRLLPLTVPLMRRSVDLGLGYFGARARRAGETCSSMTAGRRWNATIMSQRHTKSQQHSRNSRPATQTSNPRGHGASAMCRSSRSSLVLAHMKRPHTSALACAH